MAERLIFSFPRNFKPGKVKIMLTAPTVEKAWDGDLCKCGAQASLIWLHPETREELHAECPRFPTCQPSTETHQHR